METQTQSDNRILYLSIHSLGDVVKSINKYIDKNDETLKFILAKIDELDKRLKIVENNVERLKF